MVGEVRSRPLYCFCKRSFDLVMVTIAIILLTPLFLIVAAAVKLSSRGPVFYRGERVGLLGRPFRIWKFRSMQVDSERHGTTTALGDSRITRVGAFIRYYKLDELPQLINVISGEMSMVGPRPEVEEHTREYRGEECDILSVKPGITDFASIRFSSLDECLGAENAHEVYLTTVRSEKNRLRIKYVREQGFFVDLLILFRTALTVFRKALRR
jgi:lipopolysaccharide/colanic/teichoic acid biosynthesis glycosyltransferase